MIGAIIGDVAGSIYEFSSEKPLLKNIIRDECFFTDDSVLSVGVAVDLIEMKLENTFGDAEKIFTYNLQKYGRKYGNAGYGYRFRNWLLMDKPRPYKSYGNGAAMRIGPVGYAFDSFEETMKQAVNATKITHNHRDGLKGAKAVAGSIFLARNGESKERIKQFVEKEIGYKLNFKIETLHKNYTHKVRCKYSVPQAIYAFLVSDSFEDAIRKAVYIGGDTDTVACIAGSIAEAFYKKIPREIVMQAMEKIDTEMMGVINEFNSVVHWKIEQTDVVNDDYVLLVDFNKS